MEDYRITNKRDCIIFSVGKFVGNVGNRGNAQIDAERLRSTFTNLATGLIYETCYKRSI